MAYPSIYLRGDFEAYMGREGAYQDETMHFEALRLKSYFRVLLRTSSIRLAAAGFYATGDGDETRCYSCGKRYSDWQFWDKPHEVSHYPHCRHHDGGDPRNVSFSSNHLPIADIDRRIRHVFRDDHDLHPRSRADVIRAQLDLQRAELDLRLQILEAESYDGVLLWKIRDYKRRKQEAVNGHVLSLYSQPFYTSRHGYRMCAWVYLNGDGMGKTMYISLFFVIMRGKDDSLLPWPFQQKVTLYLLDQEGERRHLSDYFHPDPSSSSFRKPQTEMNIATGCPQFVSHTVLENSANNYLEDDTIFIKVAVETANLRTV